MCIVKTIKNGNITVNFHDDYIPKDNEGYKNNLKIVYDTLNIIYRDNKSLTREGKFATTEELMKTNEYEFI